MKAEKLAPTHCLRAVVSFPITRLCWSDSRQQIGERITNVIFFSWRSQLSLELKQLLQDTRSLQQVRGKAPTRETRACVSLSVCLREQERENTNRLIDSIDRYGEKQSVGKTEKQQGTWIGRIVEDSVAAGLARAPLSVHQFQIIPAAAKVSLSHILNPFLFRDTPDCCCTPNYSGFVPVTHNNFFSFLLYTARPNTSAAMLQAWTQPAESTIHTSSLTPTPRWKYSKLCVPMFVGLYVCVRVWVSWQWQIAL